MVSTTVLVLSLALGAQGGTDTCSNTANQDCLANDIGQVQGKSADDCCAACSSMPGCGAYVFASGGRYGNTCYLKTACIPTSGCGANTCIAGVVPAVPQPAPSPVPAGAWYDGLPNVHVLSPGDAGAQDEIDWVYNRMRFAQFSYERHAFLLTSGDYGPLQIPVGYYTSVLGVGQGPSDVVVDHFSSTDGAVGGATQVFWKAVEGLTATNASITYAASQACPLRRSVIKGDLWLSEEGPPHWSSGGFAADVEVEGTLFMGTQQQYFVRNSAVSNVDYFSGGWNFVFAGVEGAPSKSTSDNEYVITNVETVPLVAGKPHLIEEGGDWSIFVPSWQSNTQGLLAKNGSSIGMSDVYIAKPGDSAAQINAGISGKRALLLTPAVFQLEEPIRISQQDFVVLGIGFPTLVTTAGQSAVEVVSDGVRVAGVLLEAGTAADFGATQALLHWTGASGLGSDIFARVGSFSQSPAGSCEPLRADVMVQVEGDGVVLDNTWFWHADHDDCGSFNPAASDSSVSGNGLRVHGNDVTVYGLKVEHTLDNQVFWAGENGQVFFYQTELPYKDEAYGEQGRSGYTVDYAVKQHVAYGLGIYIVGVFTDLQVDCAIRAPSSAALTTMLAWNNGGSIAAFKHGMVCTSPGTQECIQGDKCDSASCYLGTLLPTTVAV